MKEIITDIYGIMTMYEYIIFEYIIAYVKCTERDYKSFTVKSNFVFNAS